MKLQQLDFTLLGRNQFIAVIGTRTWHGLRMGRFAGHRLAARNGLVATGDIITDDTRLIEKLFYELRRLKGR